jgi:hypothetical protein
MQTSFWRVSSPLELLSDPLSLTGQPLSRPFPQRLCSTFRLSLLALAFNILLLVVICVVSSQSEVMAWQE